MVLWCQQACRASSRNDSSAGIMQRYQRPPAISTRACGIALPLFISPCRLRSGWPQHPACVTTGLHHIPIIDTSKSIATSGCTRLEARMRDALPRGDVTPDTPQTCERQAQGHLTGMLCRRLRRSDQARKEWRVQGLPSPSHWVDGRPRLVVWQRP